MTSSSWDTVTRNGPAGHRISKRTWLSPRSRKTRWPMHACFIDWLEGQRVLVPIGQAGRSEEHTSELQSQSNLVCRLLLEKKKKEHTTKTIKSCITSKHIIKAH